MTNNRNHGGAILATTAVSSHSQYNNTDNAFEVFTQWCEACGVVAPALKLDRWVRTNAPGKSYRNKSLAVKDCGHCIVVKDHSTGESHRFGSGSDSHTMTPAECAAMNAHRFKAKQARQQEHERAAHEVASAIAAAKPCEGTDYTRRKSIDPLDCQWCPIRHCLLVPLYDTDGKLWNVQRIYDNGDKRFWRGARVTGTFFSYGEINNAVLIAEGFATAATLYKETGKPVVAAMNAGNLLPVARAMRKRHPAIDITICGDDDRRTIGNPGRIKATEAANAVGGRVVFPGLCSGCACSDFNDMATCSARGAGAQ